MAGRPPRSTGATWRLENWASSAVLIAGRLSYYPRVLCPVCGSVSLEWETSSGRGTVYATTAVYRRDAEPHNVVLVDIEEGFRMMSRVEGVAAEEVEIGTRVKLKIASDEDGPVPVFVPEEK